MMFGTWARAARRVDDLVSPAPELGNEVLIDDHWLIRVAGPLFALLSVLLIPWIAFIALVLTSRGPDSTACFSSVSRAPGTSRYADPATSQSLQRRRARC